MSSSIASLEPQVAAPPGTRRMNIVIVGHVDHGKSTVIGRLLADTHSLPEGKLEQIRAQCELNSKPFEYAFLLDALKDEQAQGITIDAARVFFKSRLRHYLILDAPGHIEFLKNMITGAARAEAALLVIDAAEGVQENSRRHGYMVSLLGVKQLSVVVNKMDLVGWDRGVYDRIVQEYGAFLDQVGIRPASFIPVAARGGDNIAERSPQLSWYDGPTVLDALDAFHSEPAPVELPFRMPVQDVYKFTKQGDDRRIVSGTIDSGTVRVGDAVVFYPSGKKSRVKSIEAFNRATPTRAEAGWAVGFTLQEQIYITRGEMATVETEPRPQVTTRLRVSLFWLGKEPMIKRKEYLLKLGTARVTARIEEVLRVMDASTLDSAEQRTMVQRHDVAECVLKLDRAIACDLAEDIPATSRFVIVDDFEIRGGGIVREALPDRQAAVRDRVMLRNYKWEPSIIQPERRAEKYNQKAALILVTGEHETDRKGVAKALEGKLFEDGKVVYFLGIGNVLYGVDADIERKQENRLEHMRRLAEVANLMLDAGIILVVAAAELTQDDLEVIKTAVDPDWIETIWTGDTVTTDLTCDLHLPGGAVPEAVDRLKAHLQDKGVIFRPW
ncbi:MAG TPA: GTP-binding protein [Gemmatimonadales bacterium]|jgi:bifunctional enzyme CysN/CysC|nr:GTP-binding protein [Gemmatimonadales bacterium]